MKQKSKQRPKGQMCFSYGWLITACDVQILKRSIAIKQQIIRCSIARHSGMISVDVSTVGAFGITEQMILIV